MPRARAPETRDQLAARLAREAAELDAIAARDPEACHELTTALDRVDRAGPRLGDRAAAYDAVAALLEPSGVTAAKACFFAALARRRSAAWETLRGAYLARVVARARRNGCPESLLLDVVSEVELRLVTRYLGNPRALASFPGYLSTMARSVANELRKPYDKEDPTDPDSPAFPPRVAPATQALHLQAKLATAKLSDDEQDLLWRREVLEEDYAETAADRGCAPQNVHQRLARIRAKARREVERHDWELPRDEG
ncbi:MAG: sigma-70 family RNA polymerase sigma factor [Deltaproteobacteria bacterium]|nr:sigma-70 family RNA polymerase sigma factor [Deltaproteobacteria bacterium]